MIIKKGTKAKVIGNSKEIMKQGFHTQFKLYKNSIIEIDADYDTINHNFVYIKHNGTRFTFNPKHLCFITENGNFLITSKN